MSKLALEVLTKWVLYILCLNYVLWFGMFDLES